MELVMLKEIDRKGLLASVDAKKQQEKEKSCNVVVYDPKPQEVVDNVVLGKLAALKEAKTQKMEGEAIERKKLMNAVTFTDVPATIKKAGFYPDGSPRAAIAGLFDNDVKFVVRHKKVQYRSDSLSVILADVKTNWKNCICFVVGIVGILANVFISIIALSEDFGFYGEIFLIVNMFIQFGVLVAIMVKGRPEDYFLRVDILDIDKRNVRANTNFYTKVPPVPESVLAEIPGQGPFAILFEVTEGWKKIKPDPVILRIINIKGKQFFEPVLGYEMTPLEKSSLVEA